MFVRLSRGVWQRTLAAFVLVSAAQIEASAREAATLLFPVDCTLGEDCVIQNYVDRMPGPGFVDFTCGGLTYDGHRGTDIRLIDRARMRAGVTVRAAAPGTVTGRRDGVADTGGPAPDDRACGNGVHIRRDDGWTYLYCHLRKGSVRVKPGDTVAAGHPLGLVGQSGRAAFPHLHLTVRNAVGRVVDPFDSRLMSESCTLRDRVALWRRHGVTDYQPGGPLSAGFSGTRPARDTIEDGTAHRAVFGAGTSDLVFWAQFFGLRRGDALALSLTGPDGTAIAEGTHRMEKDRAIQIRYVGRTRRTPWPPGQYSGIARLIRDGHEIARIAETTEVRGSEQSE